MVSKIHQKFMDASVPAKIAMGVGGGVVIAVLICFFGFLFGWIIQLLWNALLVELFNFPEISFWQAVGLFILAKFFFGFGGSGGNQQQRDKKTKAAKKKYHEKWRDYEESSEDNLSDLAHQGDFRDFWNTEGKEAYEAYKIDRDNDRES